MSNYIVQTILHTVRTREQAENMVRILQHLVGEGYILDSKNKRQGIFWRLVEMCAKFRVGQETVLKSMRKGFMRMKSINEIESSPENNYTGNLEINDCIPQILKAPFEKSYFTFNHGAKSMHAQHQIINA